MKTKIKWRLSKLPTPSELAELVKNKIITQEEAYEVLFDQQTEEDVDADALKAEIKFLRKVVEDLSQSQSRTVTVIEKYIKQYPTYTWTQPYQIWCSTGAGVSTNSVYTATGSNSINLAGTSSALTTASSSTQSLTAPVSLSSIKTF